MSVQGTGDSVVFAQLAGAYWLDNADDDCARCHRVFGVRDDAPAESIGAVSDSSVEGRLAWSRVIMLPVAVLTVAAAVLVGVLG